MKKPPNTREKLLEVAFNLIWDSSYGSVSVDDICRQAGANKGSFYHFFPSKAALALEAYEEQWNRVRPEFERIFSRNLAPLSRIAGWCALVRRIQAEKAAEYGKVCGCAYSSLATELATQDEEIRSRSEKLMSLPRKYLEEAIADAIEAGDATVKEPGPAANRAYAVCLGMLVEARVQNSLSVLEDLEPAVMEIIGAKAFASA